MSLHSCSQKFCRYFSIKLRSQKILYVILDPERTQITVEMVVREMRESRGNSLAVKNKLRAEFGKRTMILESPPSIPSDIIFTAYDL